AREQDHTAHQWMAQHVPVFGRWLATGDIDHQRTQRHASLLPLCFDFGGGPSRMATDSTWLVCGNMSTIPALRSENPCSVTRIPRSRARLPGWQDTYACRRGASSASSGSTSSAPERGGSISTWL